MTKSWDDLFQEKEYLVLDGALGTCLECKDKQIDPLLWSASCLVTDPDSVREVHRDYLCAGADIITSSAYQISFEGFKQRYNYGVDEVNNVLRLSTGLAREAIESYDADSKSGKSHFIAASIGCYGAHLANRSEYFGNYGMSIKQLVDWHLPKVEMLLQTDLDILAFETIPDLAEVKAVLSIIGKLSNVPSWIALACKSPRELNGGATIENACRALEDPETDVMTSTGEKNIKETIIGVNCTSPNYIQSIVESLNDYCSKHRRIVVYPNRGDFWDEEKKELVSTNALSSDQFASLAVEWYHAGASIIGSCCNTDPTYTGAISSYLAQHPKK